MPPGKWLTPRHEDHEEHEGGRDLVASFVSFVKSNAAAERQSRRAWLACTAVISNKVDDAHAIAVIGARRKLAGMSVLAIVTFTLTAAHLSPGRVDAVSHFQCGTAQAVATAEREQKEAAYGARSVAIIAASLSNDQELLKRWVAPDATTTIFHYDSGITSPPYGPPSLVSFVKEIGPRRYEIVSERGAPVVPGDPCGPTAVTVTLKSIQPDRAYLATFSYRAGILVNVEAHDADLVAGEFADLPVR